MKNNVNTTGELGRIEAILYGVAQLRMLLTDERVKVVLPKDREFHVGEIYAVSDDYNPHLIL